ncbi:Ku protein [Geomicrobium sp. JCM 19038]|uniref:non-homologous end joining protein Ku n=1 Tax=Geomicrobium sp. JCM 19038 TaxID=1460635 RepID=UPI00045F230E|nr:Ku protein [Geomicrobium sp. JCM 19038]GAK09640.1 Ku domain protein [Geomicrobium sp. JCM 19038]
MHTMWKGTISFGLVNIPVKMHAATDNKDIQLRQLHKKCKTPIKYKKVCPNCEEEVSNDDIVKAYEYSKNKYVILDDEELEKLKNDQEDKAVEIIDFVQLDDIDPIYFSKSYYLSPNEGGSKAYALLREALKDTQKIGIAKMMIRSKEQLAVIRVYQGALVVETIHFPDEVRSTKDVPNIPEQNEEIGKKELDTAKLLIEQLTTEFEPEKYQDDYRIKLEALIAEKLSAEEVTVSQETKSTPDNVTDIMEALEKSINRAKKNQPKPRTKKKAAAKKPATTKTSTAKKKATS